MSDRPRHCCHDVDAGEPCNYGWSDTHMHRCNPPRSHVMPSLSDWGARNDQLGTTDSGEAARGTE